MFVCFVYVICLLSMLELDWNLGLHFVLMIIIKFKIRVKYVSSPKKLCSFKFRPY
jgi:hypothetical protein